MNDYHVAVCLSVRQGMYLQTDGTKEHDVHCTMPLHDKKAVADECFKHNCGAQNFTLYKHLVRMQGCCPEAAEIAWHVVLSDSPAERLFRIESIRLLCYISLIKIYVTAVNEVETSCTRMLAQPASLHPVRSDGRSI